MTTPQEIINKYEKTPFDLYRLRGQEFTILEDLPVDGEMRQIRKKNKWDQLKDFFFLKIEQGLFQKDLEMTENEMLALFIAMPKAIKNYKGVMVAVAQDNKMKLTYIGTTDKDVHGNIISQQTQTAQEAHTDQRDLFVKKLTSSIVTLQALGNKVDAQVVMKICENMTPGKALELFQYAKTKGAIHEVDGVYKVA
jgi:hypothetical protein